MPNDSPFREHFVPDFRRVLRGKENFHAVFAGVTGRAILRDLSPSVIELRDLIARRQFASAPRQRLEKLADPRALHRETRVIGHFDSQSCTSVRDMLLQPGEIFLDPRSIHDQEKLLRLRSDKQSGRR